MWGNIPVGTELWRWLSYSISIVAMYDLLSHRMTRVTFRLLSFEMAQKEAFKNTFWGLSPKVSLSWKVFQFDRHLFLLLPSASDSWVSVFSTRDSKYLLQWNQGWLSSWWTFRSRKSGFFLYFLSTGASTGKTLFIFCFQTWWPSCFWHVLDWLTSDGGWANTQVSWLTGVETNVLGHQ